MNSEIKNLKIYLGMIVCFTILILGCVTFLTIHTPLNTKGFKKTEIEIPRGSSLIDIVSILRKNRIIDNARAFMFSVKVLGKERALQAGNFKLSGITDYENLIHALSHALPKEIKVTIPEGLKSEKIAAILQSKLGIDSLRFINYIRTDSTAMKLGVPSNTLDGFLYPSTYRFYENEKLNDIAERMVKQFFQEIPADWRRICDSLDFSLRQVVIMASMIEGEAMKDEERPLISAVFYNRLKKRMRLQACSTIQYLLPEPRRLLNRDLKIDSPYNTYLHYGLPPGPINNPGKASLRAAFFPAKVDYLYFVARGDGYHNFATTNEEFIRAKNKFQKIRRQVRRQKGG